MAELRANGNVQAIGLGVNEIQICMDYLEIGNWDVFLLAGRYTLLEQTPLDTLFQLPHYNSHYLILSLPLSFLAQEQRQNYSKF